jgi:uncharacterized integral membrane protein
MIKIIESLFDLFFPQDENDKNNESIYSKVGVIILLLLVVFLLINSDSIFIS